VKKERGPGRERGDSAKGTFRRETADEERKRKKVLISLKGGSSSLSTRPLLNFGEICRPRLGSIPNFIKAQSRAGGHPGRGTNSGYRGTLNVSHLSRQNLSYNQGGGQVHSANKMFKKCVEKSRSGGRHSQDPLQGNVESVRLIRVASLRRRFQAYLCGQLLDVHSRTSV